MEQVGELMVLQPPAWGDEQRCRRLRHEALHSDVGRQAVQQVDANVGIFLGTPLRYGHFSVGNLPGKTCAANELQLVQLERVDR